MGEDPCFLTIVIIILSPGCLTISERISRKTPEELKHCPDVKLCNWASVPSPAIESEILKRGLLTELEYKAILEDDHSFYPKVGMRKCEMWAFSDDTELLKQVKNLDGTVLEEWRLFQGPYMFFKSWGGSYLRIQIKDDKIISVVEEK